LSEQSRPDVFIAEPVGSCTDLKATVSFPLRRIYGNDFTVAPLSVMVDPMRALRILGVEPGKPFSQKVLYVYGKQLEEAEIVVVNKVDLLSPERLAALRDTLRRAYPKAEVIEVSARHRTGLQQWFDRIASAELQAGPAMQVDYDLYAEGEALLGWLNCTAKLSASTSIDGNALVQDLARRIQARLADAGQEIAHLKMTLAPDEGNDLAVLNLVRNDHAPELSHQLQEELASGELIVNLRAEADPDVLRQVVEQSLAHAASAARVNLNVDHLEHFRPGRPQPTHRLASV
jgi:G3E family GTPase